MAKFKEQLAYDSFKGGCAGKLKLERIENQLGQGMPDVLGTNRSGAVFWLELKALLEWPKRATTCPLNGKFEKGQLAFMAAHRTGWNGHAFVLLRVGAIYYLLKPFTDLEKYTKEQLMNTSIASPLVAIGKDPIIEYLSTL
jgi:hypothetical protein